MSKLSSVHTADINRRQFLAAGTGLSFSLVMGAALGPMGASAQTNDARMAINVWVNIASDNTITILAPTAEMGQGTLTTLPLILAEELDADWSKVKVEIAPPNPKIYGNTHPLLNGGQASLASVAVPGYFKPLRVAGAQARRVLMDAVAAKWSVPISELSTQNSTVVHAKSNQRISYGEWPAPCSKPKSPGTPRALPQLSALILKNPRRTMPNKVRTPMPRRWMPTNAVTPPPPWDKPPKPLKPPIGPNTLITPKWSP